MKKIFFLLLLVVMMSTTSQSKITASGEYNYWGDLMSSGGIESIVPRPSSLIILGKGKVNQYTGRYVSFSVWIKTTGIEKNVQLYIGVAKKNGDNINSKMEYIATKNGWNKFNSALVFVLKEAKTIDIGVVINGKGKVEYHTAIIK